MAMSLKLIRKSKSYWTGETVREKNTIQIIFCMRLKLKKSFALASNQYISDSSNSKKDLFLNSQKMQLFQRHKNAYTNRYQGRRNLKFFCHCGVVTLNLFVSQVFLGCRILRYIFAAATAIKKRGYLPPCLIKFFIDSDL